MVAEADLAVGLSNGERYHRCRALAALAGNLPSRGIRGRVTESGREPVLSIGSRGAPSEACQVVCRFDWKGVRWFRRRDGGFVAPADVPREAARRIASTPLGERMRP